MTFTTPPDGSIVFTAAALAEHDRQEREKALAPLRAAVVDALDNADDSDIGWDAEMSATSLLELIDEQASNVVEPEPFRVGGTVEQHAARADRWLDAYQDAVTYIEPEKMRAAYVWATEVNPSTVDVPKAMSDWLLDGLSAQLSSRTGGDRG